MVFTNVLLYLVRNLKDRYQESKYIGIAMLLMSETLVVGVPIAVAVGDSEALHVVLIGVIAVHDIGVLSLLFLPKIMFQSIADEEKYRKEDDVILASLVKASTSKFGEAINMLDELAQPNNPKGLTRIEQEQLRLVKTLLIQGKNNAAMHVPSLLFENRKSNQFILKEFAGLGTHGDQGDSMRSINLSMISQTSAHSDTKEDGYAIPELYSLLDDEQRRNVFRLLSWSNLKQWEFSVLDLLKANGGHHPLLFMGWAILGAPYSQLAMAHACGTTDVKLDDLNGYDFRHSRLRIPLKKLCDYLRAVEADYKDNPYHNATHAADVVQTLHCLIQMASPGSFGKDEIFSILLSAVVHDVKHPGMNNAFQVNAQTNLALVYNDKSVLENQHAAHAFMLMLRQTPEDESETEDQQEDLNFLSNVDAKVFATVRSRVVEAVLATDMSTHFGKVDEIKGLLADKGDDLDSKGRWTLLSYMLHVADISNAAKGDPVFRYWTDRCLDEFFGQGDTEAELGLPISPLCDRLTTDKSDSQIGFIRFVVKPSFETLSTAIPGVQDRIIPVIESNLKYWESRKVEDKRAKEAAAANSKAAEESKINSAEG